MFDKYKRNAVKFILEGLFFSSDIKTTGNTGEVSTL